MPRPRLQRAATARQKKIQLPIAEQNFALRYNFCGRYHKRIILSYQSFDSFLLRLPSELVTATYGAVTAEADEVPDFSLLILGPAAADHTILELGGVPPSALAMSNALFAPLLVGG